MSGGNIDFSGLDQFSASSLLQTQPDKNAGGAPVKIAIELIDFDPNQPRKSIDQAKVEEMAESITKRGLLQPISVRPNPEKSGHYLVNFGERRFRAHKHLGLKEIEARVQSKEAADLLLDQVVENIQREDLSPSEIVNAIAAMKAAGMKPVEIAAELGKSKAWVSKRMALVDLPAPLAAMLENGQARDVSTLYEALQCFKANAELTSRFLEQLDGKPLVQSDVERLRAEISRPKQQSNGESEAEPSSKAEVTAVSGASVTEANGADSESTEAGAASSETAPTLPASGAATPESAAAAAAGPSADDGDESSEESAPRPQNVQPKNTPDPDKYRKPLVQVRVGRREGVMLVNKRAEYGLVWVQFENGEEDVLDVGKVKVVAITDGTKTA